MKNLNAFFFMALAWMLAGTSVGQTQGDLPAPTAVNIAGGMSSPTVITHAGDERIFVALQPGTIEIMYRDGSVEASPFLDITDRVYDSGSEQANSTTSWSRKGTRTSRLFAMLIRSTFVSISLGSTSCTSV